MRQDEGSHPVETQFLPLRRRAGPDAMILTCLQIFSPHPAKHALKIHRIEIAWVDQCHEVVAAVVPLPVLLAEDHRLRLTTKYAVVLGAAPYLVGLTCVHRDGVELGDGQRVDVQPRLGPIVRDIEPAIGAQHDPIGIVGIDEHVVIVAMGSGTPSFVGKHGNGALGDDALGLTCVG